MEKIFSSKSFFVCLAWASNFFADLFSLINETNKSNEKQNWMFYRTKLNQVRIGFSGNKKIFLHPLSNRSPSVWQKSSSVCIISLSLYFYRSSKWKHRSTSSGMDDYQSMWIAINKRIGCDGVNKFNQIKHMRLCVCVFVCYECDIDWDFLSFHFVVYWFFVLVSLKTQGLDNTRVFFFVFYSSLRLYNLNWRTVSLFVCLW